MTVAPEASELNLSMEEAAILDAALGDGTGEFVIVRPYVRPGVQTTRWSNASKLEAL